MVTKLNFPGHCIFLAQNLTFEHKTHLLFELRLNEKTRLNEIYWFLRTIDMYFMCRLHKNFWYYLRHMFLNSLKLSSVSNKFHNFVYKFIAALKITTYCKYASLKWRFGQQSVLKSVVTSENFIRDILLCQTSITKMRLLTQMSVRLVMAQFIRLVFYSSVSVPQKEKPTHLWFRFVVLLQVKTVFLKNNSKYLTERNLKEW